MGKKTKSVNNKQKTGIDFIRAKKKVGRTIKKQANETDTSIRAKRINLPGQSIAAEFESPGNAWSGVWMAALFFFVTSAFPFHRARVFFEPEVRELRQTLHSLVSG